MNGNNDSEDEGSKQIIYIFNITIYFFLFHLLIVIVIAVKYLIFWVSVFKIQQQILYINFSKSDNSIVNQFDGK